MPQPEDELARPPATQTAELRAANEALRREIGDRRKAEQALRGSENQLRLVADNIPALIAYVDSDERYRFVNRRYGETLEMPPEEIIGQRVSDILGETSYAKISGSIRKVLSGQEASHVMCLPLPDGRPHWVSSVYVPEQDTDGKTRGFFALIQDVTELKSAEQKLKEANDSLEQRVNARTAELRTANQSLLWEIAEREQAEAELRLLSEKLEHRVAERTAELQASQEELLRKERLATLGQLTATVGHELRNPLGAMIPSLYLVRKQVDPDNVHLSKALDRIERSITRCDRIIDELLDFTRIGQLDLQTTRIDAWLAELLDEQIVPNGVTVVRDLTQGELTIELDRQRFRRAVINVYDNACQAMMTADRSAPHDAGSRLTVSTRVKGRRLEVSLTDTGPGIAADVLPQIFEPLYSTKGFGVGLGLPTVRQILQQHGGTVDVETEPGHGTRMTLCLPLTTLPEARSQTDTGP